MFFTEDLNISREDVRTLFIIDILKMRDINSAYGYENGDFIIQQLKDLLNDSLKQKVLDVLNNENIEIHIINPYTNVFMFKVIHPINNINIRNISNIFTDEILTHPFKIKTQNVDIHIDVTIGCSKSKDEKLILYAEKALCMAKQHHQNFSYFDPEFFEQELLNNKLITTIKHNITNQQIVPYFQPIMNNKTNKVHKYESLMRLVDEEDMIISPNAFLEASKHYRLYTRLMYLMLEKVFSYITHYKIHVSINLEYNDIVNPLLKNQIIYNLEANNVGEYLTIEILESEKIQDFSAIKKFIYDVKYYGVKIAIDDFGSGFSNYENILELDIDYVKLDGSLVKKIDDKTHYNLINSIITFCKQEDIKVIAEFVKDIAVLRYVQSLDIEFSQGYYIGKPEPIENLIKEDNEK
jgi:EAL domain-containing protein (putative c-di-GMP-specific phosphodiesterase class I)/GGDEF domain-containing protein